jgi:DmsE family decaheme c-type cytochrome
VEILMTVRRFACVMVFALVATWAATEEPITMSDCAMCHEDIAPAFASGHHGRLMARQSEQLIERSCEACHGSAAKHGDDPSTDNIVRVPGPEGCVSCHPDSQAKAEILLPRHNRSGVVCLECHVSGHDSAPAGHLLSQEPLDLCSTCHQAERAAFNMPHAHRDGQVPFDCTECHSVHADNRQGRLTMLGNGGACIDCHTEKAGPFVFPHPPSQLDSCMACHVPHGSTNPRLLTRHSVTMLCLECHANVPAFHDISRPRYQNCQTCHAAVHGSNRDPRLFEE